MEEDDWKSDLDRIEIQHKMESITMSFLFDEISQDEMIEKLVKLKILYKAI